MFDKIIIAEDHESLNISVQKIVNELRIPNYEYVYYCDDALARLKKAKQQEQPFQLLITDLYFDEDGTQQEITDGIGLVTAAKALQPNLKTLVFSAENRVGVIDGLFKLQGIDGFVKKARNDAKELQQAIEQIFAGETFLSPSVKQQLSHNNCHEFTEYDIRVISLMANGVLQKDIPLYLKQHQIKPAGLSTLEKRLNHIKEALSLSNNGQLVAFCKDLGII